MLEPEVLPLAETWTSAASTAGSGDTDNDSVSPSATDAPPNRRMQAPQMQKPTRSPHWPVRVIGASPVSTTLTRRFRGKQGTPSGDAARERAATRADAGRVTAGVSLFDRAAPGQVPQG